MANHSTIEEDVQYIDNTVDQGAWSGGERPFKASYGKLMMWYFLLSDAFTFAGFLIAYGALRFSSVTWPVPDAVFSTAPFNNLGLGIPLPLIFVTFMTFVLIFSSVTMVRAVQEGHRENKNGVVFWMFLTILGGAAFLGCQAWEWTNLIYTEGMTITKDPFGTHIDSGTYMTADELKGAGFVETKKDGATYYLPPNTSDLEENRFYTKKDHHGHDLTGTKFKPEDSFLVTYDHNTHHYETSAYKTEDGKIRKEQFGPKAFGALFFFITGFHGFHVLSGVVFLLIIMLNVMSGLYVERRNGYEMVEKIGLYWHFVDLVWVFVFLVFYLL